jgi:hypothetical protein
MLPSVSFCRMSTSGAVDVMQAPRRRTHEPDAASAGLRLGGDASAI